MGITIHYRGTIDDMARIEEFEDRVLDVAFALGGRGSLWRSYADHDPQRIVRGVMLEMSPGQETTSLLLSPEGQLIGLMQIEDAEQSVLSESPWCFVKTQFGSIDGHAAIVELLSLMKQTWFSDLEVSDESGYWDHRDPVKLADIMSMLRNAIREMGHALTDYGLSREAAEDPEILISRIQRVAALVARKICNPSEQGASSGGSSHPEPLSDVDSTGEGESELSFEESVARAEKDHHRSQLRSERIMRRIREEQAKGATYEEAMRLAMEAEGLLLNAGMDEVDRLESWESDDESWRDEDAHAQSAWEPPNDTQRPADPEIVIAARSLLLDVMKQAPEAPTASSFFNIAQQGMMDVLGGLAQATADPDCTDDIHRSLVIVQLKRALKAAGFARGAIFGLRSSDQIEQAISKRWLEELDQLTNQIQELLADAWKGPESSG
jgi:hypothetical protein